MFRQRNQGSKLVKSYHLHKHTRKIKGQKYIKNMPENNQTTLYARNTDKAELHIKDMKSVVRGGQKNCEYWNLHPVVMSDCSFIATRNSHAKHNKSVGRIPRGAERGQKKSCTSKSWVVRGGHINANIGTYAL